MQFLHFAKTPSLTVPLNGFGGCMFDPPAVNGHFNGQPKPALLLTGPGLISNGFTHTFIVQMNNSLR